MAMNCFSKIAGMTLYAGNSGLDYYFGIKVLFLSFIFFKLFFKCVKAQINGFFKCISSL